jgi:hypothetical protein
MSWIEVVDGTGRVVARRTALGVPCTVGSAVDNTLVVEDPEVAPYHARIDREDDGSLTVTVLGGSSGLHRPGAPERAMSLALTRSAAVAMGGSVIRIVDEATREVPVAAAVEPPPTGWRAFIAQRPVQWASVAVLTVIGAGIGFFTLPGSERGVNALVVAVVLLFFECLWAGAWALAGRMRHGRAKFGQHFVVATAIAALGSLVGEMESWQKFLVPGATAIAVTLTALTALIWVLALLSHMQVMNRANWHRHVRIAATFGVAVFILVLSAREYRGQWTNDVEFSSVLKAWPARLVPAKSPEQLTASLKALQDQLDHDGEVSRDAVAEDSTSD